MAQREETRLLLDSMNRLFEERSTKEIVDRAEKGAFPAELWKAVAETGVPLAAVPEAAGGIGAEWGDILAALRVAGRHAAPIPLAETMIAAWLAAEAGLETTDGPMSFGPVRKEDRLMLERDGAGWRLSGTAARVPWGRQAEKLVLLAEGPGGEMVVALDGTNSAEVTPGKNLAGEPRDTLRFEAVPVSGAAAAPAKAGVDRAEAYRRGALSRALLMSGAMERALDIALAYVPERKQFGRPISKFQAVQQNMAVLAGQVAAAGAAADGGAEALSHPDPELRELLIAVAKTRCGDAATLAAELAHQVHGAIGFTQEYALQLFTRRLWSWRDEFGAEGEWAAVIGRIVCARGAAALWPTLTQA
ncbi:MAG TPA: acyl-CoA dehydrogenase family protein [Acetobacteraceae bacterium]|nr:acyl-CoA dehydrogenase family protein [Acetobacteraceae bacterium]